MTIKWDNPYKAVNTGTKIYIVAIIRVPLQNNYFPRKEHGHLADFRETTIKETEITIKFL